MMIVSKEALSNMFLKFDLNLFVLTTFSLCSSYTLHTNSNKYVDA